MDLGQLPHKLVQDLQSIYQATPAEEAADCIDAIERRIADVVAESIVDTIASAEKKLIKLSPNTFTLEGITFEVIVDYRDILRDDTVAVLIASLRGFARSERPAKSRCVIDGRGKYKSGEIFVPQGLSKHLESVTDLTQKLYAAGYAWLEEFLLAKVQELESSLAVELYRAVRLAFATKLSLIDSIWLVLIHKDHGTYLFDQRTSAAVIDILTAQRGKARPSPAALFLGLLTSPVLFDQMFSRHTIPTGECLRCDLAVSEYLGTEPLYTVAEHVLYNSKNNESRVASIFPLARENQPYLIAAFPTSLEGEILPVLKEQMHEIKAVFDRQKRNAKTLVNKIASSSKWPLPPGKSGEFVGGVIKALTDL